MNATDFKTLSDLLAREIAPITEATFNQASGIWRIKLATEPPLQLLWINENDDRSIIVARYKETKPDGEILWDGLWQERNPKDDNLAIENAVVELKRANSGAV
jgi:hypothetical protein